MFHCTTRRCNGVFSDYLPLTKEEAMEHVYMGIFLNIFCKNSCLLYSLGPRFSSTERRRVTWTLIPLIITLVIFK